MVGRSLRREGFFVSLKFLLMFHSGINHKLLGDIWSDTSMSHCCHNHQPCETVHRRVVATETQTGRDEMREKRRGEKRGGLTCKVLGQEFQEDRL
jgi:hypothetical protein